VVVLDLDMPDMSGAQVLAAICQQRHLDSTRVVIDGASADRGRFAAPRTRWSPRPEGPVGLLGAVPRLI